MCGWTPRDELSFAAVCGVLPVHFQPSLLLGPSRGFVTLVADCLGSDRAVRECPGSLVHMLFQFH